VPEGVGELEEVELVEEGMGAEQGLEEGEGEP
jgi:hypothetical protein